MSFLSPHIASAGSETTALDYDADNNLIYQGTAEPGTSKAAAAWKIKKFSYDGITLCRAHHPRKRAEKKRLASIFKELVTISKK